MDRKKRKRKKTVRIGLLSMLVIFMLPFIISYADAYGKIIVDEGVDWGMEDDFDNCDVLLQVKVDDGVRKQTIDVEPNAFGKDNPTTILVDKNAESVKIEVIPTRPEYFEPYLPFKRNKKTKFVKKLNYEPELKLTENKTEFGVIIETYREDGTKFEKEWTNFYFIVEKMMPPEFRNTTISPGKNGFHPGGANIQFMSTSLVTYGHMVTFITKVYDEKDRLVYSKNHGETISWFVTFEWNGKPTKNNKAGLNPNKYVPKGNYRMVMEAHLEEEGYKEKSMVSKNIKVLEPVSKTSKYGNDQKNMVPLLTGEKEVDWMAEEICKKIIKPGMKNEEKLKAIYTWCVKELHHVGVNQTKVQTYFNLGKNEKAIEDYKRQCDIWYEQGKIVYDPITPEKWSMDGSDEEMSEEFFILQYRNGSCTSIATAFQVLAHHAGFYTGLQGGQYINQNGSRTGHTWNFVWLNGKMYWIDADVELQVWNRDYKRKKPISYNWFLKTDKEFRKNHDW